MKKEQRGVQWPPSRQLAVEEEEEDVAPPKVGEKFYSCAEAGEATSTTERFWRGMVEKRRVSSVTLGKYRRISESAINEMLAAGHLKAKK